MDKKELKKAIINALATGDVQKLRMLKIKLNPKEHVYDQFYAIYVDGKYTGEAYDLDGNSIELGELVEVENESDELPILRTIIITVPNKELMWENINIIKGYRNS